MKEKEKGLSPVKVQDDMEEKSKGVTAGIWLFIAFFCFLGTAENESMAVIIIMAVNLAAAMVYAHRHLPKLFSYEK